MFYIVKKTDGYIIWEATPDKMFEFTRRDRALSVRLDHNPFKTRAEAESRLREMWAESSIEAPAAKITIDPTITLYRDGNTIIALIGPDLHDGTAGAGDTVAEALRDLADTIEREGWVIPGLGKGLRRVK